MEKLYENIKARRIELGLTQDELARKMGYADKSMIAKIESGKVDLAQSKILAFAKALGTTPSMLMGGDDDDPAEDTDALMAALERAFNERPEMRTLFSIAEKATADDVEKTIKILEMMKGE